MVREDTGNIINEASEEPNVSSSRSTEVSKEHRALSSSGFDFHWDDVDTAGSVNEAWHIQTTAVTVESPGIWDPNAFEQQAPSSWKQTKEPKRIQDISSPLLVEPEPNQLRSNSDEEEWPFKSPCKMEEQKKKKKMTPKKEVAASSDIESEDESPLVASNGDKFVSGARGDRLPDSISHTVSDDADEDDDIDDDVEEGTGGGSKKKDKLRSSSQGSKSSKDSSRRSKKKDHEPSLPRRGRGGRPDAEDDDAGQSPSKPRRLPKGSGRGSEGGEDPEVDSTGRPKKPKRRATKSEVVGGEDAEIPTGSFHKLAKDADKKLRSSSKSRKTRAPGSAGSSGRRRRVKDKSMDASGHSTGGDDDADEFGEEEHEIRLKGDDDGTPGGGRPSWRERRAQNLQAPGSGGRRPPTTRRNQLRRASSERWKRTVEGVEDDEGEEEDPNKDMARSAHVPSVRRYNSGGVSRMSAGLGTASYHGAEGGSGGRHRTPNRRPPRKAMQTPNSDNSGGSFGQEDYEYDMNLSGRSARTLDSIEDLEDFEHVDFQTPGMVNYDDAVLELMQKANPEYTSHLQRRVNRKREAVNYDQSMPMMSKQALMTRTASTQVQRQFVDQSGIDRRRLMVRSMSNSSMASNDELAMSQHRQQFARTGPSRRPPPRTRSSGMAALSRSEHPQRSEDPRRGVYRTKSGASTSSFRQNQKPNRVLSVPRRADGTEATSRRGPPEERKGNIARAQSMHAAVGRKLSPKKPERRVPRSIDTKTSKELPHEKSKDDDDNDDDDDDDDSSVSEDSEVESEEEEEMASRSPLKPRRKVLPIKKVAPMPPHKKTDKRDFSVKRNRAKLHSMIYESKMGVDMDELLKQVQQGEVQRSPIKTLLMPSP